MCPLELYPVGLGKNSISKHLGAERIAKYTFHLDFYFLWMAADFDGKLKFKGYLQNRKTPTLRGRWEDRTGQEDRL